MSNKRKHSPSPGDDSSEELDSSVRACMSDEEGGLRIDDIYVPPPPRPPGTIDASGPRLIISKIVNTNFKSYGGVQVLGPFHKNFNAIVGPNGSGKSNVIDSMLFVFGYRASKIRSKKLSVLLHKSTRFPNVQSCSVAVHFKLIIDKEGDNAYDEVPGSEFSVSRTVHKDNSSYYQLNGSRVQYKEIASLLRKHGVDLDHNRFLILQGEVEQISLMKPKAQNEHETGMLEYLEDIIGTTRFKEPLLKLEEKIEVLSELRNEKLNRVKLAQREKDDLKEPMLEAVKFLELENEVVKKKNFLYQRQINQLSNKIESTKEKYGVLSEKEAEMAEMLDKLGKEKKTREAAFSEQNKKYESLNKRKDQLTEDFDKANNKDVNLQAEMQEINKRRKKIIELLREEKAKFEEMEKVPERNIKTIEEYEGREKKLAQQHETLEAEKTSLLASLREETLELQEKKEKLQTKLVGLRKVVDETKSGYNLAESELKLYVSNEQNERQKLETLKTTFEENKDKLNERSKALKDLKQKVPTTEKQYKDAVANLERVKLEEAKVINEIKVQRVQVEETRSSMQATKSRGRVLDALTRQKVEGNLDGLFGRLGDLGAIDQKYDVAISTACGPLDNIVVDTVDTAQWCIEFLKAHNIGRATFIALDKQEHLRQHANSRINTPENVPRLFDLIKIEDERVRPAFYYGLRDTLVANDIEQATRIAYGAKRFRVVSLKGDLIETSGTMSGGGRSVLRGRMGQSVAVQSKMSSPRKIQDMEVSLEKLEQKARELHQKQTALEDEVSALQGQLRVMKTDLEKFTFEVQSLQQQQPALANQLKKQEQKVKECCANPAQVKKLQGSVDSKKAEFEQAQSKSQEMQNEIDIINNAIKDKTDKKMKGVTKKIKECSEMLEKCKAEVVKMKVAIKTAERNALKSKDRIATFEQEKSECEKKLLKIQAERKDIEKDAAIFLEHIEKITTELAEDDEAFTEQREQVAELNKKLNTLKSEKIELDHKISEFKKTISENKEIMKRVQAKLAQLELQEIPGEEPQPLRQYTEEELLETDTKHMEVELKREEEQLKVARPNLTAIKEYKKKEASYLNRVNELDEVTDKRRQMRELREELRKKRQSEFHAGFNMISSKLKEMYQLITLGGDAELEMVDSYDPFAEGIVLNVRPPKKSWKNITNLSGGEKTLSSLALVFALHYYKPSPLYFMDEIDAALDFKNVSIVGYYIKERTKNAQFIIISLRTNMFEITDLLIGIYKTYDITKCVPLDPNKLSKKKKDPVIDKQTQQGIMAVVSNMMPLSGTRLSLNESLFSNSQPNLENGDKNSDDSFTTITESSSQNGQDMEVDTT